MSRSRASQEADAETRRIRFEMGREIRAARLDGAVGLRLVVRTAPGAGAPIDAGQLALLSRLRKQLPADLLVRTEVPLSLIGDRRAWDAVVETVPSATPVEAETRLRDLQAIDRRSMLKLRDSGFDRMVLLIADTSNNRRVLDTYRTDLRSSFPLDTRQVMGSLRSGNTPAASGIVIL